MLRRFAVVAGGPGTGKTTTSRASSRCWPSRPARRAPRPARRARRADRQGGGAPGGGGPRRGARPRRRRRRSARSCSGSARSTLHRLLGWRPGQPQPLPPPTAPTGCRTTSSIVDETSMVSLSLMARLVEAVRPEARLVLVGDPGQLTSIEAGAVLGDIVGPAAHGLRMRPPRASARLAEVTGQVERRGRAGTPRRRRHRRARSRAPLRRGRSRALADAIRRGDADAAARRPRATRPRASTWIASTPATEAALDPVRDGAVGGRARRDRGRRARATRREALARARRLPAAVRPPARRRTASRPGPRRSRRWLAAEIDGFATGRWYLGRPLLVTENDYGLRLFNGDMGVVVAARAGPRRRRVRARRRGARGQPRRGSRPSRPSTR